MTWPKAGGGGGGGSVVPTPGGSTTQVQYNNAGLIAGAAGLTYDNTTNTVTLASGTQTTAVPILRSTQTWNNAAMVFDADVMAITNTASSGSGLSSLFRRSVNSVDVAKIDASGRFYTKGLYIYSGAGLANVEVSLSVVFAGVALGSTGTVGWSNASSNPTLGTIDTSLSRLSANILAVNSAHPSSSVAGGSVACKSVFSYNSYTDAANYERVSLTWASNVAGMGPESLGTGQARLFIQRTGSTTVAGLPSAVTYAFGRCSVTDSTTTFTLGVGSTVVGGGANIVPVWSDGVSWRIG